jgi:hypothetical protein
VDSPDLTVNSRPGSVSRAGRTGRTRALWEMHLGARVGKTGAGEGCTAAVRGRRTPARNRACGKAGKRGEKGPAMLLTATRSSWGTCATAESARAVARGRPRCGGGGLARLGFAR